MSRKPHEPESWRPKIGSQDARGGDGEHFVATIAWQMRCRWTPTGAKYGAQDGFLEMHKRRRSTGLVFGVEIKTGLSYCEASTRETFKIRVKSDHLRHWRGHSIPFIVVWYDPTQKRGYWHRVATDEHVAAGATSVLLFSRRHRLTANAQGDLLNVARAEHARRSGAASLPLRGFAFDSGAYVDLRHVKRIAKETYEQWRLVPCVSPEFGPVSLPHSTWDHLTAVCRSKSEIAQRLALLSLAGDVLRSDTPAQLVRQRSTMRGTRTWWAQTVLVRERHRRDARVKVVTMQREDGSHCLCSVYEERLRDPMAQSLTL